MMPKIKKKIKLSSQELYILNIFLHSNLMWKVVPHSKKSAMICFIYSLLTK